ncbi:MAG TPA: hypothetical protein GXZ60_00280 [Intrasporangiaceae bacterium]|nr:hypothetical protein [Intrasporangiaceae bacterium]
MSRPRHHLTRRLLTATTAAGLILLSGCGIEERIVHLQPAPTEAAEVGAPLRIEAAEQIAARVLGEVAAASSTEEVQAAATGPAVRVIGARGISSGSTTAAVTVQPTPTILAVSAGGDWPRAILAATLDETTQVQSLHILVSTAASERFKLYATAPLLGGTAIPALGDFSDGAAFAVATTEEKIAASDLFTDYGSAITFPKPAKVDTVAIEDAYATSLNRNAKIQADALGDLGKVAQTHALVADSVASFATADGGFVALGQMVRTDKVALSDKAKELKIQDGTLQRLSGKKVVTKEFTADSLENLILVAPKGSPAHIVGAEEITLRAEGT